jgi:hypothetical protein
MKSFTALALALVSASSASAFTINFVNHCTQSTHPIPSQHVPHTNPARSAVWPAVGQAPGGAVNPNGVKFGAKLAPGQTVSVPVDDHQLVRARASCTAARPLKRSSAGYPRVGTHRLRRGRRELPDRRVQRR